LATPVNVTDATPLSRAIERAASTIAAARWRFFSSVRARWKVRTLLRTSRYGGHWHGLLFKIGLRSPRRPTCEVNVAQLAGDARRIRGVAVWRVAADV
jgi:hypothetical protein